MEQAEWGVDRVSLSVPLAVHPRGAGEPWDWGYCEDVPNLSGRKSPWDGSDEKIVRGNLMRTLFVNRLPVGLGTVNVSVRLHFTPGATNWVRLDFNPSAVAKGHTGELIGVGELGAVVRLVQESVVHLVRVEDWGKARLTRADFTRDFWSSEVGAVLEGFSGSGDKSFGRPVESVYWNGPKNCHVVAYDKGLERGGRRGEWLRIEVVSGKPWLEKAGIRLLSDLSAESVDELARGHWEATKMGEQAITTVGELRDRMASLGFTSRQTLPFLGWLVTGEDPGLNLSSATLAKYRRICARLGPIDPELILSMRRGVCRDVGVPLYGLRLDIDRGIVRELITA